MSNATMQNYYQNIAPSKSGYGDGYGGGDGSGSTQTGPFGLWQGSNANTSAPPPSLYQYQGNLRDQYGNGGASGAEAYYTGQSEKAQNNAAAQAVNPNAAQDQANSASVQGGYGGLAQYYGGVLNGTAPSLAQTQLRQATDQTIAAQQASANSARGPLAGALAQRTAAQGGQAALMNEANQSVQAGIVERQAAAAGMNNALAGQGNFSLGTQGLNQGLATTNAGLQEQQNALNQQGALGWAGMGQQTAEQQLQAGQAQGSALLQSEGLGAQQSQFNATQNNAALNQLVGGAGAAAGALMAADVKLQEPGGGSALTLREEPFGLLIRNDRTGGIAKVATQPLTPEEHRQAMAPHGAGPLIGSRPQVSHDTRGNLYAGDLALGSPATSPAPSGYGEQHAYESHAQLMNTVARYATMAARR